VTDRNLRTAITVMLVLIVIVLGLTVVVMLSRDGSSPTATARPSATATVAGSAAPSGGPDASAGPTDTPSGSPSASPTAAPTPLAKVTVIDLALDAAADPAGVDRIITFRTDAPGTIKATLKGETPGATEMCLSRGSNDIGCQTQASGTFSGTTSREKATWHVSLRGVGIDAPVVSVTFEFRASAPSIKIAHARFDGTDDPDTNGIQVRFTASSAGDTHLVGIWDGSFRYEVELIDKTSGTGDVTIPDQGPSSAVDETLAVEPGVWRLALQNVEPGSGPTELTATISWP
jgi:hypothetical protein